jgi:hypothetical protein
MRERPLRLGVYWLLVEFLCPGFSHGVVGQKEVTKIGQ